MLCQMLFCIPQRYDFSSKSQLRKNSQFTRMCCFVYRKGTIFQANHNTNRQNANTNALFCIPQRYDFSSKSQLQNAEKTNEQSCFVYRKGTIFQANHNANVDLPASNVVVLYTAKVRFFKQITTIEARCLFASLLFCIPQRYDFSSKSQQMSISIKSERCCFVYRKGTIFQANHNQLHRGVWWWQVVLYTAKVRFFKQITTYWSARGITACCFVYRKGTIFQANHNHRDSDTLGDLVVLYTAKVRFFKQITTRYSMFVTLT